MTPRDDEYGTPTTIAGEGTQPLGEKSPAELEAEINQIRAEMDSTLNAIEHRISPGDMLDRALHSVKGGPVEFATELGRSIRDNPIPATLVGIGLGWLFLNETGVTQKAKGKTGEWKESDTAMRTRSKLQDASHTVSERFHRAGEKLHEVGDRTRETKGKVTGKVSEVGRRVRDNPIPAMLAGIGLGWLFFSASGTGKGMATGKTGEWKETGRGMTSRAREKAEETSQAISERFQETSEAMSERFQETSHSISDRLHRTGEKARGAKHRLSDQAHMIRERAQQARGGYRQLRDEQPMLLIAMGVAVGVVLGVVLPLTRKEEEMLGETGAEVRARAKEKLHEQAEKVGQVASAAAEAAREESERQFH